MGNYFIPSYYTTNYTTGGIFLKEQHYTSEEVLVILNKYIKSINFEQNGFPECCSNILYQAIGFIDESVVKLLLLNGLECKIDRLISLLRPYYQEGSGISNFISKRIDLYIFIIKTCLEFGYINKDDLTQCVLFLCKDVVFFS